MNIENSTIQKMIGELTDIASRHSGEHAQVKIIKKNDSNYIQITIPNKTSLDIEFHRLNTSEC